MAKKKAVANAGVDNTTPLVANGNGQANGKAHGNTETQQSSLSISRNKHWRYISTFHGPWLQLPYEILETLAHTNYLSPRPRQTEPGILFDLLKIRSLVDEASDLAVRAQNGTASSALGNNDNGFPGGAFGMSNRGVGGNAKLSPERKYRMRELAVQRLSHAYRLDEVAASVATMQSSSSVDTVAGHVLQRAPANADAKYVHFFHEKIPSRMMAECTPLTPLNEIIAFEPDHAAPLRTRALTRIFKDDQLGAIQDLTEALTLCKMEHTKHNAGRNQIVTMKAAHEEQEKRKTFSRDWMHENKVTEEDQPKGLEMQLLFQRANLYLAVACQYIRFALEHFRNAQRQQEQDHDDQTPDGEQPPPIKSSEEMEAYRRGLEAREMIRKNAKKALRDYTAFLSHLDYAYATSQIHDGERPDNTLPGNGHRAESPERTCNEVSDSTALTHTTQHSRYQRESSNYYDPWTALPEPVVYDVATVLSASPPSNLPLFPAPASTALTTRSTSSLPPTPDPMHIEMVTYHPFLPEALHSFLLTHALLQTPPTTLLRLANNVARVARLAEGYPFFVAARSPARVDWTELLRKTRNWIGLSATWETLCKPPAPSEANGNPSSGQHGNGTSTDVMSKNNGTGTLKPTTKQTQEQKRDRIHRDAVIEALGDERVVDDHTFQQAVSAREKRALQDLEAGEQGLDTSIPSPSTSATSTSRASTSSSQTSNKGSNGHVVAKDEEYLIGTERADAIARWVLEAPVGVDAAAAAAGVGIVKKRRKKPVAGNGAGGRYDSNGGAENGRIHVENSQHNGVVKDNSEGDLSVSVKDLKDLDIGKEN